MNLFYNLLIVERIFLIINAEDVVNILDNADSSIDSSTAGPWFSYFGLHLFVLIERYTSFIFEIIYSVNNINMSRINKRLVAEDGVQIHASSRNTSLPDPDSVLLYQHQDRLACNSQKNTTQRYAYHNCH